MSIEWTTPAISDVDAILSFIGEDDPEAAMRIARVIAGSASRLGRFPLMGRQGKQRGTREYLAPRTHYLIVYRVVRDSVQILRVLHTSQQWPQ